MKHREYSVPGYDHPVFVADDDYGMVHISWTDIAGKLHVVMMPAKIFRHIVTASSKRGK